MGNLNSTHRPQEQEHLDVGDTPSKDDFDAVSSGRHHKTRRSQESSRRRQQQSRRSTSSSSSSLTSFPAGEQYAQSSPQQMPQHDGDKKARKQKHHSLSESTASSYGSSSSSSSNDEDSSTMGAGGSDSNDHAAECSSRSDDIGCTGCIGGGMRSKSLPQIDTASRVHGPPPPHRPSSTAMGSLYTQFMRMQWNNLIPYNSGNDHPVSTVSPPDLSQSRSPASSTSFFSSYDTKHIVEQKHRTFWELVQKLLVLNDAVAMIRVLLDYLVTSMEVASCAVFLIDQNTQMMSRFSPGQMLVSGIDPAKGMLGKTLASGEPTCNVNFRKEPMYDPEIDLAQKLPNQKLLSVPLIENEVVYAVIQATTKKNSRKEMDDLHIKLLLWLGPILSSCMRKCIEFHDVLLSDRTQKALLHIISSSDTEDTVLNLVAGVIAGACHITKAERLSLFMIDWETEELWSLSSSYHEEALRLPIHASILGTAAKSRTILNVSNPPSDPRYSRIMDHRRGVATRCALYVPVGVQNMKTAGSSRPIAVLEILNKVDGEEFTFDDECAFEAFASQVAVILRRRNNEIEYIKLLADTRAEKVLAQRAKSQVNILEAYTSYSSALRRPSECLRNSFLKSHSRDCPACAGKTTPEKQVEGPDQTLYHGCSWHRNLERPFAKSGSSSGIPSWDFNVFQADMDSLPQMIEDMFMQFSLPKVLGTTNETMQNFIMAIKENYHPNPFHNFLHAFSVVHTAYLLLSTTEAARMLRPLDIAGCLIAALCHDVDHPGHTNGFEIASGSQLAMLYSDESVLERHHAYTTFKIMTKEKNANILENLSPADYRHIRKVIITAILGTDMAGHFKFCETLEKTLNPALHHLSTNSIPLTKKDSKPLDILASGEKNSSCTEIRNVLREAVFQSEGSAASTPRGSNSSSAPTLCYPTKTLSGSSQSSCTRELGNGWMFNGTVDERLFIVKTIVHASDLSGQVFSKPVALKWSNMISKEFAYQALLEQAENHPISYHHLNDPLQMVEGQLFFAQKIVSPLWDLMHVMFPEVEMCVENLAENVAHYEQELQRLKLCQLEEQRKVDEAAQHDDPLRRDEGLAVPGLAKCTPAKFNSFCAIPEESAENFEDGDDGAGSDKPVREFAASAIQAIEQLHQSPCTRSRCNSSLSSSDSEDELDGDNVVKVEDCESDVLLERC